MNNEGNSTSNNVMYKKKKIGEGSYGVVYSGIFKDTGKEKLYAVKRNYKEKSAAWIGNIHEADVLTRLKGHPCIVSIVKMAMGDPFDESNPMTPNLSSKKDMVEDKFHFIMDYVETSGDTYLQSVNYNFNNSRLILTQILLGLEYMHRCKIIHRDLKPANILIEFKDGVPYAKICDFGLSCNYNRCIPGTPGVVTCWYRAPEICCGHNDYDYSSDIWSFGCLVFEFFARRPWLVGVKDDNKEIMNYIIRRLEEPPCKEDLDYLTSRIPNNKNFKIITNDVMKGKHTSFESQLKMRSELIEYINSIGPIDDLIDVIRKCLQIHPKKRISIEELLNHKFFAIYKDYIQSVRTMGITYSNTPSQVIISQSKERYWAATEIVKIYNSHRKESWYKDVIIFHAIDLFDRYLVWANQDGNTKIELYESETKEHGLIHDKDETEIRIWTCVYIMHKYYSTLEHPKRWYNIFPNRFLNANKEHYEPQAESFEYLLVKHVCNYKIYRETIYEMINEFNDEPSVDLISKLLTHYTNVTNYVGSVENLYLEASGRK